MGKDWGLGLLGIGTGGDSAMEGSVIWEAESGGRLRGGRVDRGLGAETLSIHECAREPGGCSLGSVCPWFIPSQCLRVWTHLKGEESHDSTQEEAEEGKCE